MPVESKKSATSFRIDADLLDRFRRHCDEGGLSITEGVEAAMHAFLGDTKLTPHERRFVRGALHFLRDPNAPWRSELMPLFQTAFGVRRNDHTD